MNLNFNKEHLEKKVLATMLTFPDRVQLDEVVPRLERLKFTGTGDVLAKEITNCFNKHSLVDPNLFDVDLNDKDFYFLHDYVVNGEAKAENMLDYFDKLEEIQNRIKVKEIIRSVDFSRDYQEIISETTSKLECVGNSKEEKVEMINGKEAVKNYLESFDKKTDPRDNIKTNFSSLDMMLNLNKQDLWIIGARPSMGKTATMLALAKNMAKAGLKVGIFSLEMPTAQLLNRVYSSISGVGLQKITKRLMSEDDYDKFNRAVGNADYVLENMFFYEGVGTTIGELERVAKKKVKELGLDCIFIDYLQFIINPGDFQREDLRIADTTRRLKILLKKLNIFGGVLAQLNRACESRANRRPIMSDLDGSSEIEKTADIITFLYRDEYYNDQSESKGLLELITAKQRNGAVGSVNLRFIGEIQRIGDYTSKVE